MNIELISTPDLKPCIIAAWQCVRDQAADPDEASEKNLISAVSQGHLSVLRHAMVSFRIAGVSRALSHQLVRHGLSNFSQSSQRYSKVGGENWFVIPETIAKNDEALNLYMRHMTDVYHNYTELIRMGIPAEDARYVLPNATKTALIYSANLEAFCHMIKARTCKTAQWEIRVMAVDILGKLCRHLSICHGSWAVDMIMQWCKPDCDNCLNRRGCKK